MQKICKWCEQPFIPHHGNQKYCSDECYAKGQRENCRINMQNYRQKWGWNNKNILGTGSLPASKKDNVREEYELIHKEIHRLGLG